MKIREIFKGKEFIFIAEIGINHNGNVNTAAKLIEAAFSAGADAVKFQTFVPEKLFSAYGKSLLEGSVAYYRDDQQIEFFKSLTLKEDEYRSLMQCAKEKGIVFFSSVFDDDSLELLENLQVQLYKIASSEVTNLPLLELVGKTKKPVLLSTGICTEEEIEEAIDILRKNGTPDIILLHCVSLYPLPAEKANLKRIETLRARFNVEVGFSDHSPDFKATEIAVALGSRIFEKHFKLGHHFQCPDAAVSLTPEQFFAMRQSCMCIAQMLGDGTINYDNSQKEVAKSSRRSIYAAKHISAGTKITKGDVVCKRPGMGLPPAFINKIIGAEAVVDIEEDSIIKLEYLRSIKE